MWIEIRVCNVIGSIWHGKRDFHVVPVFEIKVLFCAPPGCTGS